MKRVWLFAVLLLLLLSVGILTGYIIARRTVQPKTFTMCTTQMMGVYAEPNKDLLPFDALGDREKVWFSGTQVGQWLFVNYARGAGWIESGDFQDCPPDVKFNLLENNRMDG